MEIPRLASGSQAAGYLRSFSYWTPGYTCRGSGVNLPALIGDAVFYGATPTMIRGMLKRL